MDDISEKYQDLQIRKEPNVELYFQGLIDELSVKEVYQAEIEIEKVLDYLNKKGDQFGELSSASFRHNKDNFSKVNLDTSILHEIKRNLYSYERWKKVEELVLEKANKVDNNNLRNVLITGIYGYNSADYYLKENMLRYEKCRGILHKIKSDPIVFFDEALNKRAQEITATFFNAVEASSKNKKFHEIQLQPSSGSGRGYKKELPQKEIEAFVNEKLSNDNNKRYIHQNGKWEGNPNWNQLSEAFLEENDWIEKENIITKRRLKDRLKVAYDVIKRH